MLGYDQLYLSETDYYSAWPEDVFMYIVPVQWKLYKAKI